MTLQELQKLFNEYYLPYDLWETERGINVEVNNGDWKHDHMRLDYFMDKWGFELFNETVTEDDGSDTWSSIHHYTRREA